MDSIAPATEHNTIPQWESDFESIGLVTRDNVPTVEHRHRLHDHVTVPTNEAHSSNRKRCLDKFILPNKEWRLDLLAVFVLLAGSLRGRTSPRRRLVALWRLLLEARGPPRPCRIGLDDLQVNKWPPAVRRVAAIVVVSNECQGDSAPVPGRL